MKRSLIILLICISVYPALGQTRKIDSLKQRIRTAKTNPAKLAVILDLFKESDSLPADSLWQYALTGKALSTRLNKRQAYSLSVLAQAKVYLKWGSADSALALVTPELAKYKVEDPASRALYFEFAEKKITCISINSNYKDGMPLLYDLLNKAQLYKDSVTIANSMNTLAAWKYDMDFLAESRMWDYRALSYTRPNDARFLPVLTGIYCTLGDNYRWIKRLDSAAYCINKAIALCTQQQNLGWLTGALQRSAGLYIARKEYPKAEAAILESIRLGRIVNGNAPQQDNLMFLAAIYERSGKLDQAIEVLNTGIRSDSLYKKTSPHAPKGLNQTDLSKVFYYEQMARCYHRKGDLNHYAATLEKIIAGKDAFYKANSAAAIAELETKYEVQKKEATIARQKLVLAKDNYLFWGSIIFSALAAIIVLLIFREYRRKQAIKIKQLHDEEKRLAAQAIAEAEETERRRIAADLHDNLGAQLSFIKRNVNFIMDQPDGFNRSDERKYLGYVNDIAQSAMIDLRETIWVLNKDEVTVQEFADKLKSYLRQQLLDKDRIRWEFEETISETWKLPAGEVMHLFRIVQEVVSNIIKHSEGSLIRIGFISREPENYRLTIADNGKGFDTANKYDGHYGLENIRQRAGEIDAFVSTESRPGEGTKVTLVKDKNNPFELFTTAAESFSFTA